MNSKKIKMRVIIKTIIIMKDKKKNSFMSAKSKVYLFMKKQRVYLSQK